MTTPSTSAHTPDTAGTPVRSRRRRPFALAAAALATAALGAGLLAQPSPATSATPDPTPFAPQLVEVSTPRDADRELVRSLGLDITEHVGHDDAQVVLHTASDLQALRSTGLDIDVKIADLGARDREIAELDAAYAERVGRSPLPSGRTGYRSLADYNSELRTLARTNRKIVKFFTLERPTLDGRPVNGIEIGAGVRGPETGKPVFLIMGLHHAREWPSGENTMEFAHDLVKNFGKDRRITRLLRQARVIVVPVVNPDGFHFSRTHGEYVDLRDLNEIDPLEGTTSVLATPGRAYMRKNCRLVDGVDIPDGTCFANLLTPGGFGLGTDLNRNYGGFWGGPGASTNPAEPDYRGASAFSEPETQNIRDLARSLHITMLITNHTYSNLVLRPNGVAPTTIGHDGLPVGDAPDERAMKRLGARMAKQNGYANQHSWQLYDTTGGTEDYTYNAFGGFGYTFEIGPDEFHPPYEEVVDEYLGGGRYDGKGNREAYLIALEHAVDTKFSGVLKGRAPKGATLRLQKKFRTPTWSSSFADFSDTSMRVGRSGKVSWIVNPSTRPVVEPRPYEVTRKTPEFSESWTEPVPVPLDHTDHELVVDEATDVIEIDLDWALPDDLDLEVYLKRANGSLTEVGSSGNAPAEKEHVTLVDAAAGTYVIRVINYASATPTYDLTAEGFDTITRFTKGKKERYLLTCSKGGKVLQKMPVYVERGQVKKLNLAQCRRRA